MATLSSSSRNTLSIGLFIPTTGDAGIWGPSCRACAELAVHEMNAAGGIGGREARLRIHDAGSDADLTAALAKELIDAGTIDAIVSMSTSNVRQHMEKAIGGRVPLVYTPLWEGGASRKGVYCIGETPAQQLRQSLDWMANRYRLRSWYLIGHDYIWPRVSNRWAYEFLTAAGCLIAGHSYVPLEASDFGPELQEIRDCRPDAVLISLVGQGSVLFNRQFAAAGLSQDVLRLSTAIEENMLLGIGEQNSGGLFVSAGYFATVQSSANGVFKERYYQHFGENSPPLNAIGQSVYEGVHFLRALDRHTDPHQPLPLYGARRARFTVDHSAIPTSLFLAEATGLNFSIRREFSL